MWSKGAVVVVKRGDPEMANEMEKMFRSNVGKHEEGHYCFIPKRHTKEELETMIENAEILYGRNWIPPIWMKWIVEGVAFIVYHVCLFIEKYLIL